MPATSIGCTEAAQTGLQGPHKRVFHPEPGAAIGVLKQNISGRNGSMRMSKTILYAVILAATLATGSAATAQQPMGDGARIGVGMICNSPAQAARFVELRSQGRTGQAAMDAVNAEAHDPQACGLAAIAFTQGQTLELKPVANKLVQVIRVNILAGFDGNAWQQVSAMTQYAVMEGEGESI